MIDERSIVNGVVGLHATGGSTNHTMHLVAMARAAGIVLTWQDISELSDAVPLLARVYPNGPADVNHFHAAGGLNFLIDRAPVGKACCMRMCARSGARGFRPMRWKPSSAKTERSSGSRSPNQAVTRRW
jgi:hypothetical protein